MGESTSGSASGRRCGMVVVFAVVSSICGLAQAQELTTEPTLAIGPSVAAEPNIRFDAFVSRVLALPKLSFAMDPAIGSRVREGSFPASGGVTLIGAGTSLGASFSDRWVVPVFGVDFATAIGSSERVVTSADGSLAELHPWTSRKLDLWILGFGVRAKKRRWMVEATIEPGVSVLWANGGVATGTQLDGVLAHASSFAARGTIELCHRFDPTDRGCLFASAAIYDFGLLNGGTVGIRWELGP